MPLSYLNDLLLGVELFVRPQKEKEWTIENIERNG